METSSISVLNSAAGTAAESLPVKTLNQEDFLKLLVAQLTSQDPLNPKQDTEFIAQMAQFSALEQSKSMQQDIAQLREDQQFMQANALIGRTVDLQGADDQTKTGVIQAVESGSGTPKLVIDGQSYALSDVLGIYPTLVA